MIENSPGVRVPVERFECFHISAKWKQEQQAFFYLDLSREGTKAEKAARKELAKLLTQEKNVSTKGYRYHQNVEGIGFIWRVEKSILLKYADLLDLPPSAIEEEVIRYRREFMLPPAEPIVVNRLDINDLKRPHVIGLQLSASCEQLRRALDQHRENHWMTRDDWMAINSYGAHITITREILQNFLGWLAFARPFGDMLDEAMKAAKEAEERARLWEEGAKERNRQWEEAAKRGYSQYQHYYREYRPAYTPRLSELESALEVFSLDRSVATREAVKMQYRTLAKLHHPDAGGDEGMFKRLNNANEVLKRYFT